MGVRARNTSGGSGWRNSAPAGPYTPTQQTPAPATPASVTLSRADGTVTAAWPAAAHAATYHVTYTTTSGASWQLAALDHPAAEGDNSITFAADNDATYIVGVRARNSTGGSGWVNSAPAGPYVPPPPAVPPARPAGLSATGGDGSVTLTWDDPSDAGITGWEYRVRAAPPAPGWGTWTAVPGSDASTVSVSFDGLDNGTEYRFKLRAVNAAGAGPAAPSASPWYVAATPDAPTLTAEGATETTITITLGNYSGQWYYSANKTSGSGGGGGGGAQGAGGGGGGGGQSGCVGPVGGSQATVGGLDPDTSYTVGAYTDPFCGGAIAAGAQGATLPPAPGQIAKPSVMPQHTAIEVSWMAPTGTATSYQVQYRPCQVTPPAAQPCQWRASLGSPWQPAWPPWGNGTWLHGTSGWHYTTTQPATVTGLRNGVRYQVRVRASNNTPNGTSHGPWSVPSDDVWPNRQPSLGVSGITDTTATITRADTTHTGDWYYKANTGPHSTCQGPVASGTPAVALTSLTAGTRYQYAAYTASGCATNDMIGDAYAIFDTLELAASDITATTATLTLADRNGAWYYKADTGPDTSCQGPVSTATDSLTGLTAATTYSYTAHSDSGCTTANLLATAAAFTTTAASLTAGSITTTTATLTITDHTGNWYVKETAPSTGACSATAITGASTNLSSLTAGTWYTYKAYSDSTCSTEIAAEAFSTAVTVSSMDASSTIVADVGISSGVNWMVGQAFTTGANAGGYTFVSVTAPFAIAVGDAGNVVVKLHAATTTNPSNPGTELSTLSGTDMTPATDGNYEFTCSTACTLEASTSYFVSIEAPDATGSERYLWKATSQDSETRVPTTNGWSIADDARVGVKASNYWDSNAGNTAQLVLAAVPKAGLGASSVTSTTATLTLTGQTGNWWLKRTTPSGGTCTAGESDYTHALSSLTASTNYTYKAYSDSSCATELFSASFTTLTVVAPGVPENVVAAIVRHNSRGYYDCEIELKWDAPSDNGGATVSYTVQGENPNSHNRQWFTAGASGRYVQTTTTHDFEHHYTSFTNSLGVSSGVTYNVRIRANNSAGSSSWVQVNSLSNSNWGCS